MIVGIPTAHRFLMRAGRLPGTPAASASSVEMDATQPHATRRARGPVGQITPARKDQRE